MEVPLRGRGGGGHGPRPGGAGPAPGESAGAVVRGRPRASARARGRRTGARPARTVSVGHVEVPLRGRGGGGHGPRPGGTGPAPGESGGAVGVGVRAGQMVPGPVTLACLSLFLVDEGRITTPPTHRTWYIMRQYTRSHSLKVIRSGTGVGGRSRQCRCESAHIPGASAHFPTPHYAHSAHTIMRAHGAPYLRRQCAYFKA